MFPAQTLENAIRDEIAAATNDRPTPRGAWEPEVDSLTMVRVVSGGRGACDQASRRRNAARRF